MPSLADTTNTAPFTFIAPDKRALFASISWNNITFVAGEIKEPEKNVKKALKNQLNNNLLFKYL